MRGAILAIMAFHKAREALIPSLQQHVRVVTSRKGDYVPASFALQTLLGLITESVYQSLKSNSPLKWYSFAISRRWTLADRGVKFAWVFIGQKS